MPSDFPRVVPMVSFEDVGAAAEWLARAFGFRERLRYTEADGRVTHAELELGDGVGDARKSGSRLPKPREAP